ncbi:hypothetical protein C1H46_008545 [Malus baccata]|uniref:rRNA adenine N(6)-methyltransferase n=1 Tax=Malus baccata TaxID=106549 RepID=A0A540N484_MALBA|nr:hypothetical protein C1H46_008545 [Malus baccata]
MAIDRGKRYTLSDIDCEVVTIDVVCTKGITSSQSHIVDVEDIPIFFGSDCIEDFLLWVEDVEKRFKTQPIPEREMVKIVASCLDGDVGLWCDHMQESRRQQEAKVMENDISLCQEAVEAKRNHSSHCTWHPPTSPCSLSIISRKASLFILDKLKHSLSLALVHFGINSTDVILEIGPGTGNLIKKLLEAGKRFIAVEIDTYMVLELQFRGIEESDRQRPVKVDSQDCCRRDRHLLRLTADLWDTVCTGVLTNLNFPDPDVSSVAISILIAIPSYRLSKLTADL